MDTVHNVGLKIIVNSRSCYMYVSCIYIAVGATSHQPGQQLPDQAQSYIKRWSGGAAVIFFSTRGMINKLN